MDSTLAQLIKKKGERKYTSITSETRKEIQRQILRKYKQSSGTMTSRSMAPVYTNNSVAEKELVSTDPFKIEWNLKYLGSN